MLRRSYKNKKHIIIGLTIILVIMAVGFAAFSQRLSISGTANFDTNWNVYISDASVKEKSSSATGSASVTARDKASLTTTLKYPGDKVVYNITVKNDGSENAVLDALNLQATNSNSVIKYSYAGIAKGDTITSGSSKTFTVTVEYDSTKTGTATEAQKKNSITLDLDFVQETGNNGGSGGSGSGSAASMLIAKAVTSGDGLYTDPVESGRYVYRGANPSNYIWLDLNGDSSKTDNEIFRMMSVESDNTIKVVAQNSIGNMEWDSKGKRTSAAGYCSYSSTPQYYGCNAWGSSTTTLDSAGNNVTVMPREAGSTTTYTLPTNEASLNTYLNTTYLNSINSNLQSKIATHTYNIGHLKSASGQTLETDILQESAYKWKGKIGLINATDYVRASTNTACENFYAYERTSTCYNNSTIHNYLFHSVNEWTMSPRSYTAPYIVWHVEQGGDNEQDDGDYAGSLTMYNVHNTRGVWPVFYLIPDISLEGSGTGGNPYTIGN